MSFSDTTSPAVLEQLQQRSADPKRRILFTGATIVTMDAGLGVLHGTDLLVEGETIIAIGTGLDRNGAVVVDASGTILSPASSTPTDMPGRRSCAGSCRTSTTSAPT